MEKNNRLRGKEQITIGIFTAIYFVLSILSNMSGGLHPIIWFMSPAVAGVVAATPFMIMVTKVKKRFAILMMGIVVALLYFITGQFPITVPLFFIIGAIIAEIIRYTMGYDNYWTNSLGYAFFSLGMVGSPIAIWLYRESFLAKIREFGMPESYINSLESLVSPMMLVIIILGTLAASLLGAFIAKKLFSKHFSKVGIV